MRILWHSVAPWIKTGYGGQTELFAYRLKQLLGHDVAISSYVLPAGGTLTYNGIPILPRGDDRFGNDVLGLHAKAWRADLIITLTDQWIFKPEVMQHLPWLAWTPIDHDPVPPRVRSVLIKGGAVPVAFSQYGYTKLKESGMDPLYVPHGCNPKYFKIERRDSARKRLNFASNAFVVGVVGVNQGTLNRKSLPQVIEAFARFRKKRRDAFLYLHTFRKTGQGLDLDPLLQQCGLDEESVRFCDPYQNVVGFPNSYLRQVYHGIDVLLAPYMGEGFGLPIIEAQACGTPVIVTDFSSMSELCFFGEKIDAEPIYTNQSAFQRLPRVSDIIHALEKVYNYSHATVQKGRRRAKAAIRRHYDPDRITREQWAPALEQALERVRARHSPNS